MLNSDDAGAVGVEITGEVRVHFPDKKVVLVHSRSQLLNSEPLPDKFKNKVLELLRGIGVEVILEKRVVQIMAGDGACESAGESKLITLSSGETIVCGKVINTASSHSPNTTFLRPGILDEKGLVKILST